MEKYYLNNKNEKIKKHKGTLIERSENKLSHIRHTQILQRSHGNNRWLSITPNEQCIPIDKLYIRLEVKKKDSKNHQTSVKTFCERRSFLLGFADR